MRVALLLIALVCAGCGAVAGAGGNDALERYGIGVTPPPSWEVRLSRGEVEAATVPLAAPGQRPVLGPDDLSVLMFEYEPGPQDGLMDVSAYKAGAPKPFTAAEFGPPELGGDNPGEHSFARRNFTVAGRYFDLFVEAGSRQPADVASLNDLVGSLEVRAGDFYPGTIDPPRFRPSEGWWVGAAGGGAVRANDVAEAWAATVPYRNEPRDLPPANTLEALPADGIVIWVGVNRDSRFPPTAELRHAPPVALPLTLARTICNPGWEGQIRDDMPLCRLYGNVSGQYDVDVWIFFGRGEPSAEERARAQAMLDRLELPDWGSWELDGRGDVTNR